MRRLDLTTRKCSTIRCRFPGPACLMTIPIPGNCATHYVIPTCIARGLWVESYGSPRRGEGLLSFRTAITQVLSRSLIPRNRQWTWKCSLRIDGRQAGPHGACDTPKIILRPRIRHTLKVRTRWNLLVEDFAMEIFPLSGISAAGIPLRILRLYW